MLHFHQQIESFKNLFIKYLVFNLITKGKLCIKNWPVDLGLITMKWFHQIRIFGIVKVGASCIPKSRQPVIENKEVIYSLVQQ